MYYVYRDMDTRVWLGYTDAYHEGSFSTLSNWSSPWTSFKANEPNGTKLENCVVRDWKTKQWRDEDCSYKRKIICEIPIGWQ